MGDHEIVWSEGVARSKLGFGDWSLATVEDVNEGWKKTGGEKAGRGLLH